MIFQRAIRRELIGAAGAVFITLFSITLTIALIRYLGLAATGGVAPYDVIALLGLSALGDFPILLILSGFISVLLVVTRSYRDSEMVVWLASGVSLLNWTRPVLSFAIPLVVLTLMLSFFITPWAHQQAAVFKERFQQREDIAKVSPGRFQESAKEDRIFFAEGIANDSSKVNNVFVHTVKEGKTSVVVAQEGTIHLNERGEKVLLLHNGRRYDGSPKEPEFRLMEFERYGVVISKEAQAETGGLPIRSQPISVLLKNGSNAHMGELLWRIALPLMGLLLMLLAIPLGFVNPRGGRSINLMVAVFLFVLYSNLIGVLKASVVQGKIPMILAWWPLHLAAFILVVLMFMWRLKVNSPYHPAVLWNTFKRTFIYRRKAALE